MSECFTISVVYLVAVLIFIVIWSQLKLGGPNIIEKYRAVMNEIKTATSFVVQMWAGILGSIVILVGTIRAMLSFLALVSTTVIPAVCGWDYLEPVARLLLELYKWLTKNETEQDLPEGAGAAISWIFSFGFG